MRSHRRARLEALLRARRGNISVIVAIALIALLSFGALVVDIGWARTSAFQLQTAMDAAALAGAASLDDGPDAVRAQARGIAAMHLAGGKEIVLADTDIEIGTWDEDTSTFTPSADDSGDIVRVSHQLSGLSAFFGPMVGKDDFDLRRSAVAGPRGSAAKCGILADEYVKVNGNVDVDSYNSSEGTYAETVGEEAGVCSNGDAECNGSATIYGDLVYGPASTLVNDCEVTGEEDELKEELELPQPDCSVPPEDSNNALIEHLMDGDVLKVNSKDVVTFVEGIYYFQTLEINANALVVVEGDVTICIKGGEVKINGDSIVNTSGDPSAFTINIEDESKLSLNGNAEYYGSIIAPFSEEVKLNGNMDYFGVLVGKVVYLNGNLDFHADEDLIDHYDTLVSKAPAMLQ